MLVNLIVFLLFFYHLKFRKVTLKKLIFVPLISIVEKCVYKKSTVC